MTANLLNSVSLIVNPRPGRSARNLICPASASYHPYWDLIAAIEFLPGPPGVYRGWPAFGVRHLDEKTIVWRVDAYLVSVINRL